MATSLQVGIAASLVFAASLVTTLVVGDVSDATWTALSLLVISSAVVALVAFGRYFMSRSRPGS